MRFDLTDLRLFLNVHDAGTITGGAKRTHMTLASASEHIRAMEDALGVPLLLRDRRGVRVTPAGRTFVQHARAVQQQMERMRGELSDYSAGLKGHVRLLCNTAALSEYLPQVLARFLANIPGSPSSEERPSQEIVDAVRYRSVRHRRRVQRGGPRRARDFRLSPRSAGADCSPTGTCWQGAQARVGRRGGLRMSV